jgi:hypothetical protein
LRLPTDHLSEELCGLAIRMKNARTDAPAAGIVVVLDGSSQEEAPTVGDLGRGTREWVTRSNKQEHDVS